MTANVGMADRVIRILLALTVLVLYLAGTISGVVAVVLGVVAAMLIFTAIIGWCALYSVLGFSTLKKSAAGA